MEKTNHIVVTRKEEKKLNELRHLFSLLGIDFDNLAGEVVALKQENAELKEKVASLESVIDGFKTEAHEMIHKELNQIAVNVHNEVSKAAEKNKQSMESYLFKGSRINEQF